MHQLITRSTLCRAVPAGLVVASLCVPYLLNASEHILMLWLRIAFIFPTCIILFQVAVAWSPLTSESSTLQLPLAWGRVMPFLLMAVFLLAFHLWYIDQELIAVFPGSMQKTYKEMFLILPWIALFQPLLLVAGLYGFTVRLCHHAMAAIILIVMAHQLLIFSQYNDLVPPLTLFALMTVTGMHALVSATAYHFLGYSGPVLVSLIVFSRFLFHRIQ